MALNDLTILIGSLKDKKALVETLTSGEVIDRLYLSLPKYDSLIDPEETRKALLEIFTKIVQNPWTKKSLLETLLEKQTQFLVKKEKLALDIVARLDPLTEAQAEFVVRSGIDLYTIIPYIKHSSVIDRLLERLDYVLSLSDLDKVREDILKENTFKVTAETPDKEFFKNYQISYEDIRVYSYIFRHTSKVDFLSKQVDLLFKFKSKSSMSFYEFDLVKEILLNENIDRSLYLKILKMEISLKETSNLKTLKTHRFFYPEDQEYFNFQLLP